MRKMFYLLFLCPFLIMGCSNSDPIVADPLQEETPPQTEVPDEVPMEEEEEEEEIVEEVVVKEGLLEYRAEVGTVRTFGSNGQELFTQEIVAENEEYLQMTVSIGGSPATQIYKWTATEISLVYEDETPANPAANILNAFVEMEETDTFIALEGVADWELISTDEIVTVPHGTFERVYVVRKVTDEVEDADTIYTSYFAPQTGLIKQSFELTGEQGYTGEAQLEIVK